MPLTMQGLTAGHDGYFYAAGRNTPPGVACPVWRIDPEDPSLVLVGLVPAPNANSPCLTIGIAMNRGGDLFVLRTTDGRIFTFRPDEGQPPIATEFATTANSAANIAFDRDGSLWVTDGPSNLGRVWKIPPSGGAGEVVFRIPTLRNAIGVGREMTRWPLGNTIGLGVAAGLAFDDNGDLLVSDVIRGAIWRAEFYRDGSLRSPTGCDSTYPADTLCLETLLVQHPILSGAGGLAIDRKGNAWIAVLDRNSVALVTRHGEVIEVFRSPVSEATGRRNEGPLEFPAVPALLDGRVCVSNLDSDIQDNSPNTAGLISPLGTERGMISCLDQGDRRHPHKPWFLR